MNEEKTNRIGAVILAAGLSRRMGQPKLLLPINGRPIFLYAVELALAANLSPIFLVVGEQERKIRNLLTEFPGIIVVKNEDYKSGMGSSLKKGMMLMKSTQATASFVLLADQPFIPSKVINRLVSCYLLDKDYRYLIYRPCYSGEPGHPVLFDAALFPDFDKLSHDIGGKSIIRRYFKWLKYIPFSDSSWNVDIDTPKDYESITQTKKT